MKNQVNRFAIDTLITFITRVLQLALGIGTSIIIARVLGPHGKGVYSLAILLPSLLLLLGNLGISQASVFYVGKKKYSPSEIFGNNIVLSFLLSIVCFLVGLVIICFFKHSLFPGVANIYLFLALVLLPPRFFLNFINYLLLGLQKIKEFNFINIFQSFIFLILLSIFLLTFKFGVKAAIVSNILSYFIGAIALFYLAKKIIGNFQVHLNKSYFKDAVRYGFKAYLGNIIGFLHYRIDIFLINFFLNPIAVGFYSVATGLSEKIWLISQSAGTVLFPKASLARDEKRLNNFTPLVCRNVLFITAIAAILLFILGHWIIILLFSEKFLNSILPFKILLIGAVTISGWRVLANDLYGRGKPELNIYIGLASILLNFILNILWIPKFGIAGAAWATSISYTFAFVVIMMIYSKVSGNSISNIIFVKKSDFRFYKEFLVILKDKLRMKREKL